MPTKRSTLKPVTRRSSDEAQELHFGDITETRLFNVALNALCVKLSDNERFRPFRITHTQSLILKTTRYIVSTN